MTNNQIIKFKPKPQGLARRLQTALAALPYRAGVKDVITVVNLYDRLEDAIPQGVPSNGVYLIFPRHLHKIVHPIYLLQNLWEGATIGFYAFDVTQAQLGMGSGDYGFHRAFDVTMPDPGVIDTQNFRERDLYDRVRRLADETLQIGGHLKVSESFVGNRGLRLTNYLGNGLSVQVLTKDTGMPAGIAFGDTINLGQGAVVTISAGFGYRLQCGIVDTR